MPDPNADQLSEITFLSGVNGDGTLAATSFWTWSDNQPATYTKNYESKFGAPTAGTGGTIDYAFAPLSHWTPTEEAGFRAAMALWSAVANVTFVDVTATRSTASSIVLISRGTDGSASGGATNYYPGTIGTRRLGQSINGSIDIDTSVSGFGPIGSTLSNYGGYPWTTIIHEIGHVVGLGHGGPYNEGDTTTNPQFTLYDTLAYSVMSYNNATGVSWGSSRGDNGQYYDDTPTTPMMLDIAAAQRLYGPPTNTSLSGGQTFGYHCNIGGDIGKFFDFTVNTQPVVTLWDAGTNNTLDLSGSIWGATVDLHQGSFSSVLGYMGNLAIAQGTRIDSFNGGSGDDTVFANDDGDTIYGGPGSNRLYGGAGNDILVGSDGVGGFGGDTFHGGAGSDRIDGMGAAGGDRDHVYYDGLYTQYGVAFANGAGTVVGGPETGTDTVSNVDTLEFRDGTLTFYADSTAALVMRLYDAAFGRAPDAHGFDALLDRNEPPNFYAGTFFLSAEFQDITAGLSNSAYIDYLYHTSLGRDADQAGKARWMSDLSSHAVSRGTLLATFSESAEHRARTADRLNAGLYHEVQAYQDVAALYDAFDNRLPDVAGLEHWVDLIQSGGNSLQGVAAAFAASPEFTGRTSGFDNTQLVDFMYHNTLDRAADPGGSAYWTNRLDQGMSHGDLLFGFSSSDEHMALISGNIDNGIALAG